MDLTPLAGFIKAGVESDNPELQFLAQKLQQHLPGSELLDTKEQATIDPTAAGKMEEVKSKEPEDQVFQNAMPELEEPDDKEKLLASKAGSDNLWEVLKARMK